MLNVESMVLAQRIICLKKYAEDSVSSWKIFLDHYLEKVGGKLILYCQFDTRKLPISLPIFFYKDCLNAWSSLTTKEVDSYEDVMNQVIWNNKRILSQGKSLYQAFLHKCGIVRGALGGILALLLSGRCPATYRDLLHQVDQIFFTGTYRLLQILTYSLTGRTQELLLKNICHVRPVANSISTTQFHLRKLNKWRKL